MTAVEGEGEPPKPSPEERWADELRWATDLARQIEANSEPASPKRRRWGFGRGKKIAFADEKDELSAGAIKRRDMTQTSKLRRTLAIFAIVAVSVQLLVANVFFGFYLWQTHKAGFDTAVMIAWLSATVVEVIGIVVIVARNLFPSAGNGERRSDFKRLLKLLEKKLDSK